MAKATFVNLEKLRRNQLYATADDEYSPANWDNKVMNQKLFSISQSLESAEMYVSAAKEYIESSRGVMERLTDFIALAQVDVKTAEECMVQTERRIRCLKSEINFNLAQNLDYLQQTNNNSAKNVANSRSDKTVNEEQVLNVIKKYVDNSENINKYEVKYNKYNGVTVIVIGSPNAQGNNSKYQDKNFVHGSNDSLDVVDRTLDCDLDSLDYTSDSCTSSTELGYYEIDHTGDCCININGDCEPSFHIHDKIASEKCKESESPLPENANEKLDSNKENFVDCYVHTAENYSDNSSNRKDECRTKYRIHKHPSGSEDFLIPELLSHNVEVSIFSQKKYLSDCEEYLLNKRSCSEASSVESSKSENSECLEPSDFVYFSDSPSKNVDMCRSSIIKPNECSTNENKSLLKKMLMAENDGTHCTGVVNQVALSSNIVNGSSCQENITPAFRISEDSTDSSLRDNSYVTLSEANCDTSQNEDTSDTSINEDSSDTSRHENLSTESLLNCSDSSYTEISSSENLSESKSSSNMSLTDCLDSSEDEISFSRKHSTTHSLVSDLTRSLLRSFSSSSINCDTSALSVYEDLSYASFKDGVLASKNRESLKKNSKLKPNRQSTAEMDLSNEKSETDNIRSLSPDSESSNSKKCEHLTINLESESLSNSSSAIESTKTGDITVKDGTGAESIQNMSTETEIHATKSSESNLIDVTSSSDPESP